MHRLGEVTLRRPEPHDLESLYVQKNDPATSALLGGFSFGYSRAAIQEWIQERSRRTDDLVWVIARSDDDSCLGHVGLYRVDHRIRMAEFAIMLGDTEARGRGIGRLCSCFAIEFGFSQLNLNRISLQVLENNLRARALYESLGFHAEGVLRQAQFKNGCYLNVVLMSILRSEYEAPSGLRFGLPSTPSAEAK